MSKYADLLQEKTRIRITDPLRYTVLTMLLSGASNIAKKANREVCDSDITEAAMVEIRNLEKAIELIKAKGGDVTTYEAECAQHKTFLPPKRTEAEHLEMVQRSLTTYPDAITTKTVGKAIGHVKSSLSLRSDVHPDEIDMKLISKLVISLATN